MANNTYLSSLQVGSTSAALGHTLFGVCNTYSRLADKVVTLSEFDGVEPGIHVAVRFLNGCRQASGATLQVGSAPAIPVTGPCICSANEVIIFVFEGTDASNGTWRATGHLVLPSDELPNPVGVASAGTSNEYARADHTHFLDAATISTLIEGNFISKDIIRNPYDMFYAIDRETVAILPANNTTAKRFLRSMGTVTTREEDGEIVTTIEPTAPVWDSITKTDIGLSNVSNHQQVTDVTYDSRTGAVVVTKGDYAPVTLFNLGTNAFLSTAYLPLAGGTLEGQLIFSPSANILLWQGINKNQRLVVTESNTPEQPVFVFAQDNGAETWSTLFTIRGNGEVLATSFTGPLNGNAKTASALQHKELTNATLDDSEGTFAFSGSGAPWAGHNWTGIQIGDENVKLQFVESDSSILARTYNGSTWSAWGTFLTSASITTGDNNGQIKVGDTNVNVRGLGALAFEDTIPASGIPDLSNLYVTLDTDQTINGTKTFSHILFTQPTNSLTPGILFQGTTDSAAIRYSESNGDGRLRFYVTSKNSTPIEFAWKPTRPAGQEFTTEQVVHSFSANEYILNPLQEYNSTYGTISIRPGVTDWGTIGTPMFKWGQMYALEFYGALKGNADTATAATSDANGLRIDTNYLKLSGGFMTGTIATQSPINQVIEGGAYTDAVDSGAASPNRYKPVRWTFNKGIVPETGDIITIRTPSDGHSYGVYLSMDSGMHSYPITLNDVDPLETQYPIGSCLTLIFDASSRALNIYPYSGGKTRELITGGTWRVINYYDSGAPYGVRVYKQTTQLNRECPLLISQLTYNEIIANPYMDNVYAVLNADSTKVPTLNPETGIITAAGFNGPIIGASSEAEQFSIPATVTLTGIITGESEPSKHSWVVPTTIADNVITNDMLQGGITKDKLELGVVKVYSSTEARLLTNIDSVVINGFFPLEDLTTVTFQGYRPFNNSGVFFSLVSPDTRAKMQIAGNIADGWFVRGNAGPDATLDMIEWRHLVLEDLYGVNNPPWALSITGTAGNAIRDGAGNIITDHYATIQQMNELLSVADALVFQGILDSSLEYDDTGRKRYRNLPMNGYSAGWTYRVDYEGEYGGYPCEVGDLIIAINDGPATGSSIIPQDWTVVQTNIDGAIIGSGGLVTEKSFAIFASDSGKVVKDTSIYLRCLDHTDALAGINKVGTLDGICILGYTYSDAGDLISNVADQMSFGDAGPQVQFIDDDTSGAIIFNKHLNNSGLTAAFNFVTNGGQTALKADGLVARQKVAIGVDVVDNSSALKVVGTADIQGTLIIKDATASHSLQLDFLDDKCNFITSDQLAFGNNVHVNGNIYPTTNNYYTLGFADQSEPLTWHAVYIGSSLSYGSNNQPIYWNEGIPTALTYTTNRLYYAPVAEPGATFNSGEAYLPGNHYIDNTKLAINYSQGAPIETFYVNGNARIDGTLASNSDILPATNNLSSLGTPDVHWQALYVGPSNSYGDAYTPIYWNNGVPNQVSLIQKASFTMNSSSRRYNINKAAYALNTIVIQIVITSGKENLTSPISWEAGNSNIQLSMTSPPLGPVTGYILTARGTDLDN